MNWVKTAGFVAALILVAAWAITAAPAARGRFIGVALVPFACGAAASTGWCYLDPTGHVTGTPFDLVEAAPSDLNGGPEAKFIVTLYQ
jgi:hypothetical protein